MSITATLFIPPNGQRQTIEIEGIREEDELWFVENNAKISLEELSTGMIAVYADVGIVTEGEPDEAIEISRGRTSEDTMHALRVQAEAMLKEHTV